MTSYKRLSFVGSVTNTVKAMTGKALYLVCNCCEWRKNSKEGKEKEEKKKGKRKGERAEGKRKKGREEGRKRKRGEEKERNRIEVPFVLEYMMIRFNTSMFRDVPPDLSSIT